MASSRFNCILLATFLVACCIAAKVIAQGVEKKNTNEQPKAPENAEKAAVIRSEFDLMKGLQKGTVPEMTEDDFKLTGWQRSEKDGHASKNVQNRWSFKYVIPPDGSDPYLDMNLRVHFDGPDWSITRDLWDDGALEDVLTWRLSGKVKLVNGNDAHIRFGILDKDRKRLANVERSTCPKYADSGQWSKWVSRFTFNGSAITKSSGTEEEYRNLLRTTGKWVDFSLETVKSELWNVYDDRAYRIVEAGDTIVRMTYGDKSVDAPMPLSSSWRNPKYFLMFYGWADSRQSTGAVQMRDLKFSYTKKSSTDKEKAE